MEFGYFAMTSHPPERGLKAGHEWDLSIIRLLDKLNFAEVWIGEHHTLEWEPLPAPDLLISQALMQTERIRIGSGGFILAYHHPAALANRVAFLDHLSNGRLNFGITPGSVATDQAMFNVDGKTNQNRTMMRESLDIILKLWTTDDPFHFDGQYWKVDRPAPLLGGLMKSHLKPLQKPYPPIAVSGSSRNSEMFKLAGERGYLPMSLNLHIDHVKDHWSGIAEAAGGVGRTANRKDWRIVRTVFVAETDEEAWKLSVDGMMGRMSREYWLSIYNDYGHIKFLKHDTNVADSDVTTEYLARNNWIIGSPATVARKIEEIYDTVNGFGALLIVGYDYLDQPGVWENSLRLLSEEVYPRLKHLSPN